MAQILPQNTEAKPFAPAPRVNAPWQLRQVYGDLYQADRVPNEDRATILDGLSGGRPFDEGELQVMGRPDMLNFNWGQAEALVNAQISLYNKMLQGNPWIARFVLKTDLKGISPSDRQRYADILAEEFHILNFRRWPRLFWSNLQLLREYVMFGVAFAYFGDDMDWRWHPGGLNHVKLQRMEKFYGPDCTEVAFIQQDWTAADLVAPLRNGDDAAREQGWDPDALRAAINYIRERTGFQNNLEQFVHEIKNNELFFRSGRAATLSILFSFVQEFSGQVSWYIMTEDAATTGGNKNDNFEAFLFKKENAFDSQAEVFIPHLRAVSTGELHSVRGMGWNIFEPDVQSNRIICMMLTNLLEAGTPMVQAGSEDANEDWEIFRYGGSVVLPPGMQYIDRTVPNLAPNMQAARAIMEQVAENVAGALYNRTTDSTGQPETATQVRTVTDNNMVINDSERLNFLESRAWLYTAQWKRILKSKATYPGGSDAQDMIKRCMARGVPDDIIFHGVDYVEPMVAMITPGTVRSSDDQLKSMLDMVQQLPPQARVQVQRAALGHMAGWQNADIIMPQAPMDTPSVEKQFAIMENGIFSSNGGPLPVLITQDHIEHAIQHTLVGQNFEKMAAQALNTRQNDQIAKGIKMFGDFTHHLMQHLGYIAQMPVQPPEWPVLKQKGKAFQNAFEALSRAADKVLLANARNEPNPDGTPGPGGDAGGDASHDMTDAQIKMMKAQQEMQITQQQADQESAIRQQKADQVLEQKKIKAAQTTQLNDMVASSKVKPENPATQPQPVLPGM